MELLVHETVHDPEAEEDLDTHLLEVPDEVDLSNVRAYLERLYGDPVDVINAELESDLVVEVGWVFEAPASLTGREGLELWEIPMIPDPDTGDLTSAHVILAESHEELAETDADAVELEMPRTPLPDEPDPDEPPRGPDPDDG